MWSVLTETRCVCDPQSAAPRCFAPFSASRCCLRCALSSAPHRAAICGAASRAATTTPCAAKIRRETTIARQMVHTQTADKQRTPGWIPRSDIGISVSMG